MGEEEWGEPLRIQEQYLDAAYGLIRRHVVPPANSHASQVLPALLEAEDAEVLVWETRLIRVGY